MELQRHSIDVTIGDRLLIQLDKNFCGRVVVNGQELEHVTKISFSVDIDGGRLVRCETQHEDESIITVVEQIVDPRLASGKPYPRLEGVGAEEEG